MIRSRLIGHSRHAIARVNMRLEGGRLPNFLGPDQELLLPSLTQFEDDELEAQALAFAIEMTCTLRCATWWTRRRIWLGRRSCRKDHETDPREEARCPASDAGGVHGNEIDARL